jgi:hypothetical protein
LYNAPGMYAPPYSTPKTMPILVCYDMFLFPITTRYANANHHAYDANDSLYALYSHLKRSMIARLGRLNAIAPD